ncbi:hypothetical protein GCM10009102_33610 [Sphingomonas insulae]|uniref:DUF3060 domain-containing protein n=2 Tax=Sphingomonas insulae TaxID=424800 RepID=A0ABN1I0D1_9SPHN
MLAMAMLLSPVAWAPGATAQARFQGAGQTSRIDCDGGEAHIEGASNTIVVDGPCTLLSVQGAGNVVTVDLAVKSTIRVVGSSNRVTWRAPGKARPRVSSSGADNHIRPAP